MQEFINQLNAWFESLSREEIIVYASAAFGVVAFIVIITVLLRSRKRKSAKLQHEELAQKVEEESVLAEQPAEPEQPKPVDKPADEIVAPQQEPSVDVEVVSAKKSEAIPQEEATEQVQSVEPVKEVAEEKPEAEEIPVEKEVREAEVIEFPPVEKPKEKPRPKTLKEGLAKTRKGFVARLFAAILGRKKIEDDLLEEIEEILFTADIGARTAQALLESIYEKADRNELSDAQRIITLLKEESLRRISIDVPPVDFSAHKPFVLMMVGVNGTGKTTTIGKLAWMLKQEGKKVLLAAADTFRAAAAEQLSVWAERADAEFVRGEEGADPGSVVYNALNAAIARGVDVVIVDTAGRLHTKYNLMEELKKVVRVSKKVIPDAPHETWLVLDANTGQNAINQAREFSQAVNITGIVLTKLDGTAKGGIVIGICDELKLPVRYIGIGEGLEDLRPFNAKDFVDALFEEM